MKTRRRILAVVAAAVVWMAPAAQGQSQGQSATHKHYEKTENYDKPSQSGRIAPRLLRLGEHSFRVTTKSAEAQAFINQGVNLSFAFNHREAARSFLEAARLDPECAMAYWGHALVLGPNINAPMDPADEPRALELVQKAAALKSKAGPREQAYIEALAARYSGKVEERPERDRAYADAMRLLSERFPEDLDAATLYAEALMNLRAWDYWTPDGRLRAEMRNLVEVLESVLRRNPKHPGALHFYIHVMEGTKHPERAERAADTLRGLMPAAGHMEHMPAHIYLRVGRYADAIRVNESAIAADEDYITQCRSQGIYPLAYFPHNIHFLWAAAMMDGQSARSIEAARKAAAQVPAEALKDLSFLDTYLTLPYLTLARFGRWDDILAEPEPTINTPLVTGTRHFARGLALLRKGRATDAAAELALLEKLAADPGLAKVLLWSQNPVKTVLEIAGEVLAGELAASRGDFARGVAHLDRAVRLEDSMLYTEPPDWFAPARQILGGLLVEAKRFAEAEVVYWDDLRRYPDNGWSLFGLAKCLRAQGKDAAALEIEMRFAKAWERADVKLSSSRF